MKVSTIFYNMLLGITIACTALAASAQTPEQDAQQNTDRILKHISEHREAYLQDPSKLYEFVDTTIIPNVDVPHVTKLILGSAYKDASQEQRDRFATAFQRMLVRTYGNALLEYSGEKIEYLPSTRAGDATDTVIRSQFVPKNGPPVPVNYRAHLVDGKWKMYDIIVDNISLVTNYRGSFSSEIRKNGLDALIERLESRG